MRNVFIAVGLLVAIALIAGLLGYRAGCDPALHEAARQGDAMTWLKREFHLTDQQYAAIEKLHREYTGSCDEHCRMIQEAMKMRDALRAAQPVDAAAVTAADQRVRELSTRCETLLLRHLEQVAALMSPEDGRRYLETMRPLVAKFNHSGAPDLSLTTTDPTHGH
ncbi:MAG: periplasmic heavy metal sensor [Opitutaceae bacterium]